MRAVLAGLHARLAATSAFWGSLATYRTSRALFTMTPVPADAARPYATIYGPVGSQAFDTKTAPGGSAAADDVAGHLLTFDVNVYADADGDPRTVDALALAAQQAIHRQDAAITIDGWRVLVAAAAAPVETPTDDTIYGRRIAVTLQVRPA